MTIYRAPIESTLISQDGGYLQRFDQSKFNLFVVM